MHATRKPILPDRDRASVNKQISLAAFRSVFILTVFLCCNTFAATGSTIVAWGSNTYGQTNVPSGLSNVVTVAAGGYHSLALKIDRTVAAWGTNSFGQTNVPADLSNVVMVAAGGYHSLALKSDGTTTVGFLS